MIGIGKNCIRMIGIGIRIGIIGIGIGIIGI
jgi:hypothetical protein